jgi:hypothetical protein
LLRPPPFAVGRATLAIGYDSAAVLSGLRTLPSGMNRMIPDRDIWRAANLLIREHAAEAEIVAARRADEMLERGDRDGQLAWVRIRRAIVELQAAPVGKPN